MFYFIDYSEEASDFTVISRDVSSPPQRVWWDDSLVGGGVFFSSFNSLTDISACIFGHLSLMTAVCPVQERRRRFWFWWRAADCRVGAITLLPQSRLCVDWEAQLSLEKNVTGKVKAFSKYQSWKSYWGFNTWGLLASTDKMEQKQIKPKLLQISQNIHILTRTINSKGGCLTLLTLVDVLTSVGLYILMCHTPDISMLISCFLCSLCVATWERTQS